MDAHGRVDPEVAEVLAALPMDPSALKVQDLPALRKMSLAMFDIQPLSEAIDHLEVSVPGDPEVPLLVSRPKAGSHPRACLFWIHGGGYIIGSYKMDTASLDRWCELHDCMVVSVEYRLAPEHPYPAPLDDCYAGLLWVFQHAEELGIDATRLGIGGASAGGGLAAGLNLLARDRGEVTVAFQLLIAPMIDDRQTTVSSQWEAPIWPPTANLLGWQAYLGDLYGGDVPEYAAAARANDVSGLPPTLMVVGGVDGFVDEDMEYVKRMNHAGVPTELHVYPGAPHGFDGLAANTGVARRANRHIDDWMGTILKND